jgi:serine/threonine-protein kinase HipA
MIALRVSIESTSVGLLEHFQDESECFTFDESYIESNIQDRPVLGQLFEDRYPKPIQVGGPIGWFSNLLPQGAMLRWRSKLYGIDIDDSFQMLGQLGLDLPGAVVLEPANRRSGPSLSRQPDLQPSNVDNKFRFSLAGNQWKLSAHSSQRGLTTNANASGVAFIAKFHSPEFPGLPQCEFATMNWARESQVVLPEFELRNATDFDSLPEEMPVGDGKVFVCRRFDRENDHFQRTLLREL